MKLYRLYRRQLLGTDTATAWEFFSQPGNLPRITPPWLGFEVRSGAERPMYAGQILTYRVAPLPGLKMQWVTEITHVDAPHFFVDEQRFGPYRLWHHQHRFEATAEGVLMEDVVHYVLPAGLLGRLAHGLTVGRRLQAIFDYRQEAVKRLFG